MALSALKQKITALYEGDSRSANRFHYLLLGLDLLTVLLLIVSTFFSGDPIVKAFNALFGVYIALDFLARLWIAKKKTDFFRNPLNIVDVAVIVSIIIPMISESFAFLRALRIIRLLRSPELQNQLRKDFPYFRRNEDVIISAANLCVFVFIMTEFVFITQVRINPHIHNFLDAMYFTITTLTTTGFGDVTLQGNMGRALSIMIMIFGVSLFLRLIQAALRPSKVRFMCGDCGLFLHEHDAVHCKHCGKVLAIPSDGAV